MRSSLCTQPGVRHASYKEVNVLAESRPFIFRGEPSPDTSGWPHINEGATVSSPGLQAEGGQRESFLRSQGKFGKQY